MTLPTREECFDLMTRLGMPDHIRRHSVLVARVATTLSRTLKKSCPSIDLELIERGALLHDIGKARALVTREDHGTLGARMLIERGFQELAPIVKGHIGLLVFDERQPLTEILVVNYADKRVMHEAIVSLDDRFADLRERYVKDEAGHALLDRMIAAYRRLEVEIFRNISFSPEGLSAALDDDLGDG